VFTGLQPASSWFRRYRAVSVSVGAHLVVLAAIVFHIPPVIDIRPSSLAWGNGSHADPITYLAPASDDSAADVAKLMLPPLSPGLKPRSRPQKQTPKPSEEARQIEANAEATDRNVRAGSPLGTVLDGPITGHEVHVAYPVVYPDPPVARAELPRDLVGDVVIEVTIDSQGNVVETKIVQAIGHGIDEKIEATLRRWHYQPATLDGTPVASRHDVHFHFPS
jgi:TonB family protein